MEFRIEELIINIDKPLTQQEKYFIQSIGYLLLAVLKGNIVDKACSELGLLIDKLRGYYEEK